MSEIDLKSKKTGDFYKTLLFKFEKRRTRTLSANFFFEYVAQNRTKYSIFLGNC